MDSDQRIDLVAEFGDADAVVVTDNLNRRLAARSGDDRLAAIWAVLADLRDGWHVPADGVPIANVRLNFRRGERPLGDLSVGESFVAAHVHGTFLARASDTNTRERLLVAAGASHLLSSP